MDHAFREIDIEDLRQPTGKPEPKRSPAREIDQRLSELSRLYLARFKAMREGTPEELQSITDQITVIKIQLNAL
jgi:hypothetical protein